MTFSGPVINQSPCGIYLSHIIIFYTTSTNKTHDFWQSVDGLFSYESVARVEPTISEVKDAYQLKHQYSHTKACMPVMKW